MRGMAIGKRKRERQPTKSGARDVFRLLLIGYFEGLDSERGIAW
jgi:hypothetical protein